jgi:hypothetical protein
LEDLVVRVQVPCEDGHMEYGHRPSAYHGVRLEAAEGGGGVDIERRADQQAAAVGQGTDYCHGGGFVRKKLRRGQVEKRRL